MTNPMRLLYPLLLSLSLASPAQTVFVDLSRAEPDIVVGQPPIVLLELRSSTAATVDLGPNRLGYLEFDVIDPFGIHSVLRPEVPDFSATDPIALKPPSPYVGKLGGWVSTGISIPADAFQGTVAYSVTSCTIGACMTGTAQVYESDPASWPNYNAYLGPNSNDWLIGIAGACGVVLPINTWGAIW